MTWDYVSHCCGAAMTTAGGDGTHGSPCWSICRTCGERCQPNLMRGLADSLKAAREADASSEERRDA